MYEHIVTGVGLLILWTVAWGYDPFVIIYYTSGSDPSGSDPNPA